MTAPVMYDAWGRPDDGTDRRRSIARAAAGAAPARGVTLTALGAAAVVLIRAGLPVNPATLGVLVVPRSLLARGRDGEP